MGELLFGTEQWPFSNASSSHIVNNAHTATHASVLTGTSGLQQSGYIGTVQQLEADMAKQVRTHHMLCLLPGMSLGMHRVLLDSVVLSHQLT